MSNAVYTKTNEETRMQARVFAASKGGYTVTLFDIDSGNTLPTMVGKAELKDAIVLADAWVSDAPANVIVRF